MVYGANSSPSSSPGASFPFPLPFAFGSSASSVTSPPNAVVNVGTIGKIGSSPSFSTSYFVYGTFNTFVLVSIKKLCRIQL